MSLKYKNRYIGKLRIRRDKLKELLRDVEMLEVVEHFGYPYRQSGREYKTTCPKCLSRHSISIQVEFSRDRFLCNECHCNGDVLQYIIYHNYSFNSAVQLVCRLRQIPFDSLQDS